MGDKVGGQSSLVTAGSSFQTPPIGLEGLTWRVKVRRPLGCRHGVSLSSLLEWGLPEGSGDPETEPTPHCFGEEIGVWDGSGRGGGEVSFKGGWIEVHAPSSLPPGNSLQAEEPPCPQPGASSSA